MDGIHSTLMAEVEPHPSFGKRMAATVTNGMTKACSTGRTVFLRELRDGAMTQPDHQTNPLPLIYTFYLIFACNKNMQKPIHGKVRTTQRHPRPISLQTYCFFFSAPFSALSLLRFLQALNSFIAPIISGTATGPSRGK